MSDSSMELMKQYGTYFVPTITAGKEVAEKAKIKGYYNELVVPKALAIGPQIQATFSKAYAKGVKIAFGSDAGVFSHGKNAKEFGYMHEVGMPVMECLQSATITNADILGYSNELGQISEGFIADIVATKNNPIDDVSTLENVIFVMKNGVVYKNWFYLFLKLINRIRIIPVVTAKSAILNIPVLNIPPKSINKKSVTDP